MEFTQAKPVGATQLTPDLPIWRLSMDEATDECLKHSDYTRVDFTFSRLFYIYLRSFCGWIPDLVIGVYAGAIGAKRAAFGSNFRAAKGSA